MKPIVDYLFDLTNRVVGMEEDKYKYLDDLSDVELELVASAEEKQALDLENERIEEINKKAGEEIEKEYPIYKQLNITNLLIPYTIEDQDEMKAFIDDIRAIANNAIESKTALEDIDWTV